LDAHLALDDVAAWAVAQRPGTLALKPLALVDPTRLSAEGGWMRYGRWGSNSPGCTPSSNGCWP
jgi:hypothetical protein